MSDSGTGNRGNTRKLFLAPVLMDPLWPKPPRPLARPGHSTPGSSPQPRHSGLNFGGAGILNLLGIDYSLRPRLSTRLTLGGRTFPRNPWDLGELEFNQLYRYLCLHSHSQALHGRLPLPLRRTWDAFLLLTLR